MESKEHNIKQLRGSHRLTISIVGPSNRKPKNEGKIIRLPVYSWCYLLSWLTIRAGRELVGWSRLHRTHKSSRQYVSVGCSRSSSLRVLANMYLLTVSGSLTRKIQTTLPGAEATGHQSSYKRLHHIYTCCEGRSTGDTVG